MRRDQRAAGPGPIEFDLTRILLSNDDGISAPGLAAARGALEPLGEVICVAPRGERSASSHSITLGRPLRFKPVDGLGYSVDGTPCDCVFLACEHLLRDAPPDLLVSGINAGGNLGADVLYSGTVAVAVEGTLRQIPSIAVSLVGTHDLDFSEAARFLGALAPEVLRRGLPEGILLNVNVPKRPATPKRFQVTTLGRHSYADVIDAREDPRQRPYYWIAGRWAGYDPIEGSDCVAIGDGVISVTPLRFGFGADEHSDGLREWGVEGFEKTPT